MADYDTVGGGTTGAVTGAASGAMAGAAISALGGPIGILGGAILGGLFGSKKTKVPKPPSYSQMMNYNLDAQAGIQDKLLSNEATYRPRYQGLQEQTLNDQLYGGGNNAGYINMLNRSNNALLGVQGQYAQNYMTTLGGLTQQARNTLESPANAAMHAKMMSDAQSDLNLGTSLSASDQRLAYQNANQAMAMRGLSGRQGNAAGVLANYGLGQQRLGQRRQFASAMMGAETAIQNAALQAGQASMAGYGSGGKFMAEANTMLGQYQPQIFQPESQMGNQAQGMQYQQQMALAQAKMQQQSQMFSTLAQLGSFGLSGGFNGIMGSTSSGLGAGTYIGGNTLGNMGGNLNSFGGTTGATGYNIGTTTLGTNGMNFGIGGGGYNGGSVGLQTSGFNTGGW